MCINCGIRPIGPHGTKFCSNTCQHAYNERFRLDQWLAGSWDGCAGSGKYGLSSIVRKYLLKESAYKCQKCGWGEINLATGKSPLQINHIDGNWLNNRKDNLEVLCPNCHALTPNFGALNKGNGRTYRYSTPL